jgi:glutamate/tyrosine decarboxylase-like PLP-dependent enzyme
MNTTLAHDHQNLQNLLDLAAAEAWHHIQKQGDIAPGRHVATLEHPSLPTTGMGAKETLAFFAEKFASAVNGSAGPRYFGFVTGGSTPAALMADWLVSTYDQNACGSNDSIAPQIEQQTIHFFRELFELSADYFGSFVTGATVSNAVSLSLARQWVGEQYGIDVSQTGPGNLTIRVVSGSAHSSIYKSLSFLGIGRKNVVVIDSLPEREAVDVQQLEAYLQSLDGQPAVVVANAGTVNTVDFDDLESIGELKKRYPFWLHVDAAFGGFAALSKNHRHLVQGMNYADSITIDAHKWLNVPYDAAMQFTRHKSLQLKVFQNSAAYLGDPEQSPDFFHYTPENSRRWRALPSWFTLMAYGKEGHSEIVERNCTCAFKLGEWIRSSDHYQLLAPVRMNVVCFAPTVEATLEDIKGLLARIRDDGRVFFTPTVYKGKAAIRAAVSNWQTTEKDVAIAIRVLSDIHV